MGKKDDPTPEEQEELVKELRAQVAALSDAEKYTEDPATLPR